MHVLRKCGTFMANLHVFHVRHIAIYNNPTAFLFWGKNFLSLKCFHRNIGIFWKSGSWNTIVISKIIMFSKYSPVYRGWILFCWPVVVTLEDITKSVRWPELGPSSESTVGRWSTGIVQYANNQLERSKSFDYSWHSVTSRHSPLPSFLSIRSTTRNWANA